MTAKQLPGNMAPDGSQYVTLTDGAGNLGEGSTTQAVTQSGTWTVQPGNTANTTAWKVDGSAVTQPVSATALPLPTGAATSANQTATQATVAPGTAPANADVVGGIYNSTLPSPTTGQTLALQMDSRGMLLVGPDGLAVSGTLTATGNLFSQDMLGYESITVQVTSAGTTCTITYETSDDNTNWLSSTGSISTNTGASVLVTTSTTVGLWQFPRRGRYFRARVSTYTSGTVTVVGTLSKHPAPMLHAVTAAVTAVGSIAQAAAVGNINVGVTTAAYSANPAAVANAQYARPIATLIGVPISKPYSIPEGEWHYVAAAGGITNTTTAVTLNNAGAAGIRNYITGIDLASTALGAASELVIRDGAAGTVLWRGYVGTAGLVGGLDIQFLNPLKGTAATLIEFATLTASITGALYINVHGYQAP